jgi:16S rRNA A1518/A1519 N6-dimethyltransferase RsmA/KsgA/DIM1 with predicted DNA glycosylase/AP lyase activity
VVSLVPRSDPVDLGEDGRALVKDLFRERRKQLGGLLRRHRGLSVEQVRALENELSIVASSRPESLSVNDFHRMTTWLRDRRDP